MLESEYYDRDSEGSVVEEPQVELKFVQQPTKDLLERYFAEKILSLKHGLDEVYDPKKDTEDSEVLTQLQSLKAYWNICRTEVGEIVDLFGDINPATLTPNHKKIMKLSKHYLTLLKTMDVIHQEDQDSPMCLEFASTSIDYLKTLHTCLVNPPKGKKTVMEKKKKECLDLFMEREPYNAE